MDNSSSENNTLLYVLVVVLLSITTLLPFTFAERLLFFGEGILVPLNVGGRIRVATFLTFLILLYVLLINELRERKDAKSNWGIQITKVLFSGLSVFLLWPALVLSDVEADGFLSFLPHYTVPLLGFILFVYSIFHFTLNSSYLVRVVLDDTTSQYKRLVTDPLEWDDEMSLYFTEKRTRYAPDTNRKVEALHQRIFHIFKESIDERDTVVEIGKVRWNFERVVSELVESVLTILAEKYSWDKDQDNLEKEFRNKFRTNILQYYLSKTFEDLWGKESLTANQIIRVIYLIDGAPNLNERNLNHKNIILRSFMNHGEEIMIQPVNIFRKKLFTIMSLLHCRYGPTSDKIKLIVYADDLSTIIRDVFNHLEQKLNWQKFKIGHLRKLYLETDTVSEIGVISLSKIKEVVDREALSKYIKYFESELYFPMEKIQDLPSSEFRPGEEDIIESFRSAGGS